MSKALFENFVSYFRNTGECSINNGSVEKKIKFTDDLFNLVNSINKDDNLDSILIKSTEGLLDEQQLEAHIGDILEFSVPITTLNIGFEFRFVKSLPDLLKAENRWNLPNLFYVFDVDYYNADGIEPPEQVRKYSEAALFAQHLKKIGDYIDRAKFRIILLNDKKCDIDVNYSLEDIPKGFSSVKFLSWLPPDTEYNLYYKTKCDAALAFYLSTLSNVQLDNVFTNARDDELILQRLDMTEKNKWKNWLDPASSYMRTLQRALDTRVTIYRNEWNHYLEIVQDEEIAIILLIHLFTILLTNFTICEKTSHSATYRESIEALQLVESFMMLINREYDKRGLYILEGETSAGKSMLLKIMLNPLIYTTIMPEEDKMGSNRKWACVDDTAIAFLAEEVKIASDSDQNMLKTIAGGDNPTARALYKKQHKVYTRPVMCISNQGGFLDRISNREDKDAFRERVIGHWKTVYAIIKPNQF